MTSTSGFGTLGVNIGWFGRWSRVVYGALLLSPLLLFMFGEASAGRIPFNSSLGLIFLGVMALYFGVILAAYFAAYYTLGPRVFNRGNAWLNTAILVVPAMVLGLWNFVIPPLGGVALPLTLIAALSIYIGVSLFIQARIKYGGCEVVAIPQLFMKKKYATYCIPIVAADALEKRIVDRRTKMVAKPIEVSH